MASLLSVVRRCFRMKYPSERLCATMAWDVRGKNLCKVLKKLSELTAHNTTDERNIFTFIEAEKCFRYVHVNPFGRNSISHRSSCSHTHRISLIAFKVASGSWNRSSEASLDRWQLFALCSESVREEFSRKWNSTSSSGFRIKNSEERRVKALKFLLKNRNLRNSFTVLAAWWHQQKSRLSPGVEQKRIVN